MKLESLSCAQTRDGRFWIARASVLVLTACAGCDSFGDSPITPDPEASPTFDADAFLAEVLVIDGELNYFSPSSEVGQPRFESDENGLTVKQALGVATDAWMDGQWTNDEVSGDGVLDGRDRWRAVVFDAPRRGRVFSGCLVSQEGQRCGIP